MKTQEYAQNSERETRGAAVVVITPERKNVLVKAGRKGGNANKHKWTDEERAIVKADYTGTLASIQRIANKLTNLTGDNITHYAVRGQVQVMGLALVKNRRWTPNEEEELADIMGRYRPTVVARILHRSVNSVVVKSKRLGCGKRVRTGWYVKTEVASILGVDHKKVQKLIDTEELKATYENGHKPSQNGMAMWHIEEADLRDYIINHSMDLVGRNVDLFQVVEILTAGELPRRKNRAYGKALSVDKYCDHLEGKGVK